MKTVQLNNKKIAGWTPMDYDRELWCHGVRWLRVKDGMGGRGDRVDWVADMDCVCVSVHDYQWKKKHPKPFDKKHKSRGHAMYEQLKQGVDMLGRTLSELKHKVVLHERAYAQYSSLVENE